MEIRYITSEDDRMAISKIYEESWKYAYKGIIPQSYLDSIPEGCWASQTDNPNCNTLVVIDNQKIIGTSSFCKSRFEQFDNWGEIISIYLLPEYTRKGYGKVLLQSAVLELKKQGYEDIFLWVLEENTNARRFYERFGFMLTTDSLVDNIGGKIISELRYIYKVKVPHQRHLHVYARDNL